jgi:NAD(P)-dependent dehydrogenase (short-subunit alcohol dehydrogenase family)
MSVLNGRTALVTGGSRVIGRGIGERLAADGAPVVVHYATNDAADGALVVVHYATNDAADGQTVAAIEAAGGRAFPVRGELGVDGDAESAIRAAEAGLRERTGSSRLDILVNNAAVSDWHPRPTSRTWSPSWPAPTAPG